MNEIQVIIKKLRDFQSVFAELKNWKVVSFTGLFNKGKTFILSKLVGKSEECQEMGFDQITHGLCIKIDRNNQILYIDSEGFERAIQKKQIESDVNILESDFELRLRAIKEKIYQEFLLEKAQTILIVLSQTTYSDQKLIARIIKGRNFKNKKVLIIHNLYNLTSTIDIEKKIKELAEIFNFKKGKNTYIHDCLKNLPNNLKLGDVNLEYFEEDYKFKNGKVLTIQHIILAKENTKAGEYFNFSSIRHIKNILTNHMIPQQFNIEKECLDFVNGQLPHYYRVEGNSSVKIEFDVLKEKSLNKESEYLVQYTSTKPKINSGLIPNRIIMNFMGEMESFKTSIPNIKFESLPDIEQQKNDNGYYKEKIIVELTLNADHYDIPKLEEKENIYINQNDNGELELFFYVRKKKYEPEFYNNEPWFIVDDKTSSGPIKLNKVIKKARKTIKSSLLLMK